MVQILGLEGCSGVGKTTQTGLILEYISKKGKNCRIINEKLFEPFKSEVIRWHKIRIIGAPFTLEQIYQFAKARGETHKTKLKSLLKEADYILFDRCYFTSAVYQCNNNLTNMDYIIELNLNQGAIPIEKGFLLECSPEISALRIEERRLKIRKYKLPSVHETLTELKPLHYLYHSLTKNHPELIKVDASKNPKKVLEEVVLNIK